MESSDKALNSFDPVSIRSAGKRKKAFRHSINARFNDPEKQNSEDKQELAQWESESRSNEEELKSQPSAIEWTEQEDIDLFKMYKLKGSKWAVIAKSFKGKTKDSIRNRFYSTLRRIYRHKSKLDPNNIVSNNLLDYVDDAIKYGHTCFCKRGRPKKTSGKPVVTEESHKQPQKPTTSALTASCPLASSPSIPSFGGERAETVKHSEELDALFLNKAMMNLIISQQTLINRLLAKKIGEQGQNNDSLL